MSFLDLSRVVRLLRDDHGVVKNLHEFADSMKVSTSVQIPLHDQFRNGTLELYPFLKVLLTNWINRQGANATVAELQTILKDMGNNSCADKLDALRESLNLSSEVPIREINENDLKISKTTRDLGSMSLSPSPPPMTLSAVERKDELDRLEEIIKSGELSKTELGILETVAFLQGEEILIEFIQKVFPKFHEVPVAKSEEMNPALAKLHNLNLIQILFDRTSIQILIEFIQKVFPKFHEVPVPKPKSEEMTPALAKLHNLNLIQILFDRTSIQIDPKVQVIIRTHMSKKENKETRVLSSFWNCFKTADYTKSEFLHITSIWEHTAKYPSLVKSFSTHSVNIGHRLFNLGMLLECYEFTRENHQKLSSILGELHIDCLEMQCALGRALMGRGRYEESLQKLRDVYEKMKFVLGEEDPSTLETASNISLSLYCLSRYTESLNWAENVLKTQIKVFGESNREVWITKGRVALSMEGLGRFEEAEKLHRELVHWLRTNAGEDHRDTLIGKLDLASCLHDMGQYEEAKQILDETIQKMEKVLWSDHPATITAKARLARTLDQMGEPQAALDIFADVLTRREKVLGKDHPETIATLRAIDKIKDKLKVKAKNGDLGKV